MTKAFLIPTVVALTTFFTYGALLRDEITTTSAPDPRCPYPSDDITFLIDPYNCSRYYECYEGDLFIMECYEGLYWNEETLACDYPENVTCRASPPTEELSTTTTTELTTDYTVSETTESVLTTETTAESTLPDTTLPDTTPPDTTLADTTLEDTTLADTTLEDTTLADTTLADTTSNTTLVDTTASEELSTVPEGSTTLSPEITCQTAPDGTYLTDPTDCSRYYECVRGKAVPGKCPAGSLWNEVILNCDFSENVQCHTDN